VSHFSATSRQGSLLLLPCYRDPPASTSSSRYASYVMLTVVAMLTSARPPAVRGDRTYLPPCAPSPSMDPMRSPFHLCCCTAFAAAGNRGERRSTVSGVCLAIMPNQGSPPHVALLAHGRARGCGPSSRVSTRLRLKEGLSPARHIIRPVVLLHCIVGHHPTRPMSFSLPSCSYSTSLSSN